MVADAEVVLIVDEKFFKAGAGDIGELQLHLGRSDRCFAALGDVLFSGTGCLHHLVNGAVSTFQMFFAKAVGEVVDDL